MKLLDFVRRKRTETPPEPPPKPESKMRSPEDIIDSPWGFEPAYVAENGSPVYETNTIQSIALIHIARSLDSIAADLEAIREHMVPEKLPSVDAVDPSAADPGKPSTRVKASSSGVSEEAPPPQEPTEAEYRAALSVVDACLRVVVAHQPRWWALENPRNKLRRYLGPARLEFYQWEYGDPGHKPTCIWGDFVPPVKQPKPRTKPSTYKTRQENASPEDAITPAGFARAFFEANP